MEPNVIPIEQAAESTSVKAAQNRLNAKNSTGPKSEQGKRRSSLNALRHGFTSHVVVMPYEDLDAFKAFEARCHEMYAPIGDLEKEATQSLSELRWRMRRVGALESSLFTLGHERHAEIISLGEEENMQPIQSGLAAAITFKVDADTLLKLSVYEQRLSKQFHAAEARLFKLQADRRVRMTAGITEVVKIRKVHKQQNRPFFPAQFGFVSTLPEIEKYIRKTRAMEGRLDPELGSESKLNG